MLFDLHEPHDEVSFTSRWRLCPSSESMHDHPAFFVLNVRQNHPVVLVGSHQHFSDVLFDQLEVSSHQQLIPVVFDEAVEVLELAICENFKAVVTGTHEPHQ